MRKVFVNSDGCLRGEWKVLLYLLACEFVAEILMTPFAGCHAVDLELVYAFAASLAAVAVTFSFLKLEKRPLRSVGLRIDGRWLGQFMGGTLGGTLLMLLTAMTIRLMDGFRWVANPTAGLRSLASGLILYLAVAIHEEVAYRGYAFQRILEGARPWLAMVAMAVYFSWIHRNNPGMEGQTAALAFLNIALAGFLLGLCYWKTHSLAVPIGLHLGWNWAQGCLLGFGVSGTSGTMGFWQPAFGRRPQWLTGGDFGLEGSVICSLLCGLAILGVMAWKPGAQEANDSAPMQEKPSGAPPGAA